MSDPTQDRWAQWLLHRRHGGNDARLAEVMAYLGPVRDRVLANAGLSADSTGTLVDVGCGDGLIGFGALALAPAYRVVFSDISQDLLDHAYRLADDLGLLGRATFIPADAVDLRTLPDASADALTMRSVLIYVADKRAAFQAAHRVLRPGGRVSLFEPINRFGHPEPDDVFWGFPVGAHAQGAARVRAVYAALQPPATDPMLNFDERDLLAWAQGAGFREVHMTLEAHVHTPAVDDPPHEATSFDALLHSAPNPLVPTLAEAMAQALSTAQAAAFTAHLHTMVTTRRPSHHSAVCTLWAVR